MSQTIKRKAKSARKSAAAQGNRQKVRKAKAQGGSLLGAALGWVPIGERTLHRLFMGAIFAAIAGGLWLVASISGASVVIGEQLAYVASQAGFEVRRIEIHGAENIDRNRIYATALGQQDRSMLQVDLEGLRAQLLELSWVKDARVSRQLPETLVVDILERKPRAVLRKPDHFVLIDETGVELAPVRVRDAQQRLIVSGLGASSQVAGLDALLDVAPALKPQVREAEWIGNRRWNLTFRTGQVLALPEGGEEASRALLKFARLDGTNRLIGGPVMAFDMRADDRIYLRVPGREEAELEARAEAKRAAQVARADTTSQESE